MSSNAVFGARGAPNTAPLMSDRAAFLRAIADQPADRTARLVFADFLEENGDAPDAARAEFVRAQVEAETVHPNSNRRAELEARAEELFTKHWLDWWAPVCAAVGLPAPHRPSGGVRGWLSRKLVGGAQRAGRPYKRRWPTTIGVDSNVPPLDTLHRVRFGGGFPESLSFLGQPGFAAEFLRKWSAASPLAALDLHGIVARDWRAIDGPHLGGLRVLGLGQGAADGLTAVAASRHLTRLEALHLVPDRSNFHWPADQYRAFADSALAGRVTRLGVVLADVTEAFALHGAPLSNLTALEVRAPRALTGADEFARAAAAAIDLLSLPHLERVEELVLDGVTTRALGSADRAILGRLKKLELAVGSAVLPDYQLNVLVLPPALTDLSIAVERWSVHWLQALTKSPFVGRLRHLRLDGSLAPDRAEADALMRLVRALDTGRLETLRLGEAVCPAPAVRAALTERFGDRVRFG